MHLSYRVHGSECRFSLEEKKVERADKMLLLDLIALPACDVGAAPTLPVNAVAVVVDRPSDVALARLQVHERVERHIKHKLMSLVYLAARGISFGQAVVLRGTLVTILSDNVSFALAVARLFIATLVGHDASDVTSTLLK